MDEAEVVTCFLRNRGDVLLIRRSDAVSPYRERWSVVTGHAGGNPDGAAREEIQEETGLLDAVELVRTGDPFTVEDEECDTKWVVHSYLFDCVSRDITTNYETAEYEWAPPTEILHRETVPDLWESYRRVRPSVETVRLDRDHGSAYLSLRALEVLRDRAVERSEAVQRASGDAVDWTALSELAYDLLAARPGMAVVQNRVNRAMSAATADCTAAAVERAATVRIAHAIEADDYAAKAAAERLSGTVLTLSRSRTVLAALRQADLDNALVVESRPGTEGVNVAETLADEIPTTLIPDAGVAHALAVRDVDVVVVGADTVLPDGHVVNKVGTRSAALAAVREGVPMYAVTARDKVATDDEVDLDHLDRREVYDGDADLDVLAPTFDVTPADLVTVVTETGVLSPDEVDAVAKEHREIATWKS